MVWTGLAAQLWRHRRVAVAMAAVWLVAVTPLHLRHDADHALAGRDAARMLVALDRAFPPGTRQIVIGPYRPYRHDVPIMYSYVDAAPALQLHRDDRDADLEIAPTAAVFGRFRPTARLDLRTIRIER